MPAQTADIGLAIREAAAEPWSNAAVLARYPNARDGAAAPAEGFFDATSDAATAVAQRGVLIGTERRRFNVAVADLLWVDPATGIPTVTLVDAENAVNGAHLVTRLALNLETGVTELDLFG
ncbi:hypothetical protein ABC347_10955 [Sphingomonas sp. 1P06PA]|uniref:hypothetical protein n=1 Tax=Sphingomonas sp. 1P06PA TaxID=554121 RepID=UPI0039A778CC